jgi:hypothetical protein
MLYSRYLYKSHRISFKAAITRLYHSRSCYKSQPYHERRRMDLAELLHRYQPTMERVATSDKSLELTSKHLVREVVEIVCS